MSWICARYINRVFSDSAEPTVPAGICTRTGRSRQIKLHRRPAIFTCMHVWALHCREEDDSDISIDHTCSTESIHRRMRIAAVRRGPRASTFVPHRSRRQRYQLCCVKYARWEVRAQDVAGRAWKRAGGAWRHAPKADGYRPRGVAARVGPHCHWVG